MVMLFLWCLTFSPFSNGWMFMLTLQFFSLLPALFFGCVDPRCTKYLMISPTFNSCVASLLIDSISSPCFVFEVAQFFIPRWLLLTNLSVPTLWQLHLACLWMITICLLLMAVSSSNSFISCYCNFFNSSMISLIWTSLVWLSCPAIFKVISLKKWSIYVGHWSIWTASTGILQQTGHCFLPTNLLDVCLSVYWHTHGILYIFFNTVDHSEVYCNFTTGTNDSNKVKWCGSPLWHRLDTNPKTVRKGCHLRKCTWTHTSTMMAAASAWTTTSAL